MNGQKRRYCGRHVGGGQLGKMIAFLGLVAFGKNVAAQQTVAASNSTDVAKAAQEVLARRITVRLQGVSLEQGIDTVSRLAKVLIEFPARLVETYTAPVQLDVKNMPLGAVLERLLDGTALRVVPSARGTLIIAGTAKSQDDSVTGVVSGRIVDSATGHGIAGATVKIAGTKLSTVTGDSGRFTLKTVPLGDRLLTVRTFGYRPADRNITVANDAPLTLRIALAVAPNVLSGVVTTATGVQEKIAVGNDITRLNVDSIRQTAPISSVTDLLETRVPGLTVLHSSGEPGAPSRLRLRGAGSIQRNNDPIMIVDGIRVYASQSDPRNTNVPSPIDQIDPSSIETIDVLKGPSASAIYGSDAASGVIVITTKQGRAGPTHWNANLGTGVNWLPGNWPTNYYQFGYDISGNGPLCPWYDVTCRVDSVVPFQALNDSRYTVLAHGNTQQVDLNVSGGVSTLKYSLTGSTQSTLGNLKVPGRDVQWYDSLYGSFPHSLVQPERYNTWGVTGKLTATPQPTLTATLQSSLYNSTQRGSRSQQGTGLEGALGELSGEYISGGVVLGQLGANTLRTGPLISGEYTRATIDQTTLNNYVTLDWQPRPWLPLTATAGISGMQQKNVMYKPFGVYDGIYSRLPTGAIVEATPGDTTGFYSLRRGTSQVNTVTMGTLMPVLQNKISLAVGGTFNSTATSDMSVSTNQLAPGITTPTTFAALCQGGTAGCNSPTSLSSSDASTYGWYVQPTLNFNSRFFANPGFRLDGGSGGTRRSNSGIGGLSAFPKIDFSYVAVDRQDQRPLWGVVSLLRPRIAFGYAGTQPAPADKLRLYNIGSYTNNPIGLLGQSGATTGNNVTTTDGICGPLVTLDGVNETPAVCINALGNSLLRPERSSELEGGFDATLWQNRLTLTVSQYNKTRHDAIVAIPIAPSVFSTGSNAYSIQKNVGVIRNAGTEIWLNAIPLQRQVLSWSITANFSKNTNTVVRLNPGQLPIILTDNNFSTSGTGTSSQTRVQAGYPLFGVFVRPIAGYADANGDGVIQPYEIQYGDSLVYAGQPNPNYELNVSQDVALLQGRLHVNANIAYQNGLTQLNQNLCGSENNSAINLLPNQPNTPLATQAAVVAAGCGNALGTRQSPIGLVQTVNTLRFQSLSVNYELPRRAAQWFRVPRMSVALQGNNLGLHTNYRGKDPDVNGFSTVTHGDQTIDSGQLPELRTWLLKLSLEN